MKESGDSGEKCRRPPGGYGLERSEAGLTAEDACEIGEGSRREGDEHDRHDGQQCEVQRPAGILGEIAPGEQAGHLSTVFPSIMS